MESRSPSASSKHSLIWLLSLLSLGTGISGCFIDNNSDPPVLSVDLLWDKSSDDRFSPGTCDSARVAFMSWQLKEGDQVVGQSDDPNIPCEDGFDFVDVGPGNYDLSVQGFDTDQNMVWSSECTGLDLQRFDLLYRCKVLQPAPQ